VIGDKACFGIRAGVIVRRRAGAIRLPLEQEARCPAKNPSPLIESRRDLIEAMSRGAKPRSEWRVGTEHEKHVFHKGPIRPVTYDGAGGIDALLKGIAGAHRLDAVLRARATRSA